MSLVSVVRKSPADHFSLPHSGPSPNWLNAFAPRNPSSNVWPTICFSGGSEDRKLSIMQGSVGLAHPSSSGVGVRLVIAYPP